jgi:hypothetical protein
MARKPIGVRTADDKKGWKLALIDDKTKTAKVPCTVSHCIQHVHLAHISTAVYLILCFTIRVVVHLVLIVFLLCFPK